MAKDKEPKVKTAAEILEAEIIEGVTKELLAEFSYGMTIRHIWFEEHIWVEKPQFVKSNNIEHSVHLYDKAVERYQFAYMGCIDKIKSALRKKKVYLTSIRGVGYKMLTPNEHAQHGVHRLITRTDKAFQKAIQCHDSCDLSQLTKKEATIHKGKSKAVRGLRKVFNNEAIKRDLHKTEEQEPTKTQVEKLLKSAKGQPTAHK